MDAEWEAELIDRLRGEPESKADKEQRVLDLLELGQTDVIPHDLISIAEFRAGILLREPRLWPRYIQASTHDRWAWETLSGLVRVFRKRTPASSPYLALPPLLSGWVLDIASGHLERPTWKARPKLNEYRDINIARAVDRLHDLDRPYAPPSENSACHLVAERLDMPVGTVRQIWFERREQIRGIRASGEDYAFLG